jgi:hypothetical protein
MSLEHLPRIRVDFNELVDPNLVLLSKTDVVECDDGTRLTLEQGMRLIAFEHNAYGDGTHEYLYAQGLAERNDPGVNGEWTRNAQWCCRFTGGVQTSGSKV